MTEEVKPNPTEATTHDAQLAAENMAAGEEEVQKVDVDADYEASKAFSVSEVDRKGGGAEAAEAATAPKFKVPEATEMKSSADTTGNPSDYMQMAKDVTPRTEAEDESAGASSGKSGDPADFAKMAKEAL